MAETTPTENGEPKQEQLPLADTAPVEPTEPLVETALEEPILEQPEIVATESIAPEKIVEAPVVLESASSSSSGDKSENKIKTGTIVGIVIVLAAVLGVIYLATKQPAVAPTIDNGQKVVVSNTPEQGKVSIIEETNDAIKVASNNSPEPASSKIKVIVYFGNTEKNPNSQDCGLVYPLEREVDKRYDSNMINTVISLLYQPTAAEREQGYVTAIPGGTILKYLKLDDSGVVEANFSGALSKAAGSCAVTAIRAQIKSTLMQFSPVKSVVICVDGNCNDSEILQP